MMINNIPANLWGEKKDKVIIAIHGNMSTKSDIPIAILSQETPKYQVLSFDLPEHGDRKSEPTLCKPQNCVPELMKIIEYAKSQYSSISLMANSIGAYFSLLAYKDEDIKQCLFLSPVVDMKRLIENMMTWFRISPEQLLREQIIKTPIGQTLYWDYYEYVLQNPIEKWNIPTAMLCGEKDELCESEYTLSFAKRFGCKLDISKDSAHYFHTDKDLEAYRSWIKAYLIK